MAGFAKISIIGNAGGQDIVNVFWYRSNVWLPFAGNPFEEMLAALVAFQSVVQPAALGAALTQYVLKRYEGVGYTDALVEVPGSLQTLSVDQTGSLGGSGTDSFALVGNISWRCGEQHQITGVGSSRRNRGSTAWGPVGSNYVSDDGHFLGDLVEPRINNLANALRQTLIDIVGFSTLVPIRIHHARTLGVPSGITYSDILGYALPTKVSFRRSRLGEA